jgi:hypothetical protein
MGRSVHSPQNVALARATLTDTELLAQCSPAQRADLVRLAQAILQTDRISRQGIETLASAKPGAVVIVPRALWQAGLRTRRIPRAAQPQQPTSPTPGDAA